MNDTFVTATNSVTHAEVTSARLGARFGRMDLSSQITLLVVEPFAPHFELLPRDRIAIALAARTGSLATDAAYWEGRNQAGGLSPTVFTYTLPSAAIGELAIRHRLTGPNLCMVGSSRDLLREGTELIRSGEADACICISTQVVSPELTRIISLPEATRACAVLLQKTGPGCLVQGENRDDMESFCANLRAQI